MPLKRSRPKTEEKFQNAVLELVAKEGCGALGINAVAQLAGADKVLIYRYFGDFNGLIQTVAESRNWLPTCEDILSRFSTSVSSVEALLEQLEEAIKSHLHSDESLLQLMRWRRADQSALGEAFNREWHSLWAALPQAIAGDSRQEQKELWSQLCSLLALLIEAELCGEPTNRRALGHIMQQLEEPQIKQSETLTVQVTTVEESLPTNLL